MDIHEYQAKELLSKFGVPIPRGGIAYSPEQANYRAAEIGGNKWVVKAQIHSGARGKAGGIKLCKDDMEIQHAAEGLLGKRLITHQTGPVGKLVSRLYIEEGADIAKEIYFALVMDRASERIMAVASAAGGMEIEEISAKQPETIIRISVDPAVGMQQFQAREVAFDLGVEPEIISKLVPTIMGCYRALRDLDATMIEINPLVITKQRNIVALDAKMSFDDNALYRRPQIAELRDKSQEDPRETYANDRGLAYVGLDGDIGCIVNGAGLAMATLDMIKLAGGEPANFLDIGGGASPERVTKSFNAVLRDKHIKAILVNVFAGINRCDWVAKGVVDAIKELEIKIPIVVRLAGTKVEEGRRIIDDSGLTMISADSLAQAADKVVAAAKSRPSTQRLEMGVNMEIPIPPDDPNKKLTVANPDDPKMRHISVAGGTYTILVTGDETGGRYCLIDMLVPPAGGPPPHRHDFEEMFTILEGEIELTFRGESQRATAGLTVNIPANAPHSFKNTSDKSARLLCMCTPAGQEEFFMAVGDEVDSRTAPPPQLSKAEQAERGQRAKALSSQYRTELLV